MPYDDPDPQDPNVLVGVSVPADREAVREMAYAFAEEFSALGFEEERLLALFRQPFYAGPHRAWTVLGEDEIRAIVAESAGRWGGVRAVVRETAAPAPRGRRVVQIGGGRGGDAKPDREAEEGERCRG